MEKVEHISEDTADLMGHHRATADKVYHIRKKEQNTVLADAELGAAMRSAAAEKPKKHESKMADQVRK